MRNVVTESARQTLRTQQIIFGGLMCGLVAFTVVALVVGPRMSRPPTATPPPVDILRLACGILILATLAVFPLVKRAHLNTLAKVMSWKKDEDDGRKGLLAAFGTINIIGGALAEGPALFAMVILLLSANPLDLLLVAVPLAVLVWRFPTRGRWESVVLSIDRERSLRRQG